MYVSESHRGSLAQTRSISASSVRVRQFRTTLFDAVPIVRGSERKRQNVGKRMVHGGRRLKTPLLHPNFPRESNLLCLKAQVGRSDGRSPLHRCFPRCVYKRAKPAPLSLTRSLIPRPIDGWSRNRLSLSLSLLPLEKGRIGRSVGLSDGVYKMRRLSFPNPLIWIFSDSGPPPSARLLLLVLLLLFSAIFIS